MANNILHHGIKGCFPIHGCNVILNFSYTFDQIQDKAGTLWRYHLYSIVYDYCYAPRFQLIPLMLIDICTKGRCRKTKQADPKFSEYKLLPYYFIENMLQYLEL